ncbi:MAG: YraN family protein [Firmicutes bacterium]|nr:YraN family protein [Bacillota bacterium]
MKNYVGQNGEIVAKNHLISKGFNIILTNFTSRFGEIDIICDDEEYIIFVEVKSKINSFPISCLERIDCSKEKKILKTIDVYLSNNFSKKQPRIDVIEVVFIANSETIINHIENVFFQNYI